MTEKSSENICSLKIDFIPVECLLMMSMSWKCRTRTILVDVVSGRV